MPAGLYPCSQYLSACYNHQLPCRQIGIHLYLSLFFYIYKLIFNSPFFEVAFCFFAVKVFLCTKNLYIHSLMLSPIFLRIIVPAIFSLFLPVHFKFPFISQFFQILTTYFSHFPVILLLVQSKE